MLYNCFRFAPRDSIPGLISKICKYLKDHPGWSEDELEQQIKKFISETGVESFNGRTGIVSLDKNDVNNLKIASAYFAEGDESIDSLDLVSLYNQGVRFVFTDFNSATSGYNLTFALEYFSGSGNVVYYPMSTGTSGGGNIVSVNGKTGVVELSLADIIGSSSVQVKLCTAEEFMSTTTETWNGYYNEGYRIVGVVNSSATSIDYIYILKQDKNSHTPIVLSTGASDAYTPNNPPPYPVSSVNYKTGSVELKVVDVSKGNSTDKNAYIFIDEDEEYPEVVATDSAKLGGQLPEHYATAQYVNQLKDDKADKADVLTLEEIQASTDLPGKIASASALKTIFDVTNLSTSVPYDIYGKDNIIKNCKYVSSLIEPYRPRMLVVNNSGIAFVIGYTYEQSENTPYAQYLYYVIGYDKLLLVNCYDSVWGVSEFSGVNL